MAGSEADGERPGLALWGPLGRWVFLNWPRGSWQYDLICAAIIAALFLLPGPGATTDQGDLDVDGVLRRMNEAAETLESFTAGFTSTKEYALFDESEVESGTIHYLEPAFVKREVEAPSRRVEVVGPEVAEVYVPRINQVQRYRLGDEREASARGDRPRLALPGLSEPEELRRSYDVRLEGIVDELGDGSTGGDGSRGERSARGVERQGGDAGADAAESGARYYVLELTPLPDSEAARHWQTLRLWVPEGEWLPARRIVLVEHTGDVTRIDLREVERNTDLEPSDFDLDLPSGVEVVEHA